MPSWASPLLAGSLSFLHSMDPDSKLESLFYQDPEATPGNKDRGINLAACTKFYVETEIPYRVEWKSTYTLNINRPSKTSTSNPKYCCSGSSLSFGLQDL